MNLLTADINDPAAPADEVIATVVQFDHVAGIDEAIGVEEGRGAIAKIAERVAPRPDPQRPLGNPQLHISLAAENLRRKAFQPVPDIESDPSLGRGEGVSDIGVR